MRLESFHVTNFRSVEDSGPVKVGDEICLVGKNEAGKTAILNALCGLNPHPSTPFKFDKEQHYPRRHLNDYETRHPNAQAAVITTTWALEPAEQEELTAILGPDCLAVTEENGLQAMRIDAFRRYGDSSPQWGDGLQYKKISKFLIAKHELDEEERSPLAKLSTTDELRKALEALETPTEKQSALLEYIQKLPGKNAIGALSEFLSKRLPYFMYFSHYDRMAGQIRLDNIQSNERYFRQRNVPAHQHADGYQVPAQNYQEPLNSGELVFMDFLEFAGTSLEEIRSTNTYESLNAKCEGASNSITDQLREYWTQNPFLEIDIRVTKAEPKDDPPFNEGTIARARVRNTLHRVSVPFSERSAGFIWFFSFLVKFAQVRKTQGDMVLLLDEPGLTLHGKAQADLLRYFKERLLPDHQLIFTTHSPFMVPPEDLTLSRVVEDQIEQKKPGLWTTKGTRVSDEVLSVDPDSLFPLQGALGYDITQTLFLGKHTLLVEGPSDIIYFNVLSNELRKRKRPHLDARWAICPAGGLDKIKSFVSLFAGNKLEIAVMSDFCAADRTKLDQLKRSAILSDGRIMNFAEVLGLPEADVEDIFATEFYLRLVNEALGLKGAKRLTPAKLDLQEAKTQRLVKLVEVACRTLPPEVPDFDHFIAADWLLRNPSDLDGSAPEVAETLDKAERVFAAINKHIL
ncbi:AAA family ATPase [Hyphomicrobium sp. B1]|uniref:AAA family ATPase n=1 Tax=Hyphomicrobium sp. B1 TaxID=3075651 RepID=UPI003C30E097